MTVYVAETLEGKLVEILVGGVRLYGRFKRVPRFDTTECVTIGDEWTVPLAAIDAWREIS